MVCPNFALSSSVRGNRVTTPVQIGVTELLADWSKGDREALSKLVPLVYDELFKRIDAGR